MFSRNFGGIPCAATISSRFTGLPSPAASSITARTAYSAFAVTRTAFIVAEPVSGCRTGPGAHAGDDRARNVNRVCYSAALFVFPSNPIKKGEKH